VKRLIGMIAIVGFLAGCVTPSQRWSASTSALQTARTVTMTLHEGGVIDNGQLAEAHKIDLTVRGALDVAETQLPDGGGTFEEYMAVAEGGLKALAKTYPKPKEVK
jgi:hypothetical protein